MITARKDNIKSWFYSGSPGIWLTAGAVSVSLVIVLGLVGLIAFQGLGQFWPAPVAAFSVTTDTGDTEQVLGQQVDQETVLSQVLKDAGVTVADGVDYVDRYLYRVGNRDYFGQDFRWVLGFQMSAPEYPADAVVVEREEWGNFYGWFTALKQDGNIVAEGQDVFTAIADSVARKQALAESIDEIEKGRIGAINYGLERLRLRERGLTMAGETDAAALADVAEQRSELEAQYGEISAELTQLYRDIARDVIVARLADGREVDVPVAKVVRYYRPNAMGTWQKARHYVSKTAEFIFDEPREANTEGGIYPAIFGTVLMVMLMSILVTPFGVVTAIYLREYAKQGVMTRMVRIAVNNLAGVPSIVYGVFGLGFFVYFLGGSIDQLFFGEALPSPTFGTPGLLWSSLTLALLTVPVVIVATEEGLTRVPRSIREGSLALGATKAETLVRTVLPMATPAMITGLILAIARAAGEVAPLMMVGVVKLAPSLPLDGNAPYLHLDRKFMHLGFHIYDVGFQSPNVEAARPLVYATALLLVVIILVLNLAAIHLRNRLREKYDASEA